ncbi:myeloid differentiation primary response protein myd88 [Plakobranchus ocellatus]|uniref:Myeloid differentiation primary response protein myd88 n=1 Tax=Plakobranchus ocellatus TaxID=259542 RepID=A0AAV3XZX0_9GAST|nr:myeloid differentiation primary response protein myd88 [Plakobranchus ocellatus]
MVLILAIIVFTLLGVNVIHQRSFLTQQSSLSLKERRNPVTHTAMVSGKRNLYHNKPKQDWTEAGHGDRPTELKRSTAPVALAKCPDILAGMTKGRWLTRPLTDFEQMSIDGYLQTERSAFRIPPTFQRADGKCGDNITYELTPQYHHMWFKAICDPKGRTPCCKNYRCVDLSVEECRCPTCYDERQVIYPEFSTWLPDDERCQPATFTRDSACRLLRGATIHVIGDSFVREMYIALAIILTGNHVNGALKRNLTTKERNQCTGMFQVTGAACRHAIFEYGQVCGGTVTIEYTEVWNAKDVQRVIDTLKKLQGKPKSFVVMGLGIHDDFHTAHMQKAFFKPLFNAYKEVSSRVSLSKGYGAHDGDRDELLNLNPAGKRFISDNVKPRFDSGKPKRPARFENLNNNRNIGNSKCPTCAFNTSYLTRQTERSHDSEPEGPGSKGYQTDDRKCLEEPCTDQGNPYPKPDDSQVMQTSESPFPYPPHLFWLGIHAPGLLKSPHFAAQTARGVQNYNKIIGKILDEEQIPHLETFNFTNGVLSFDGTHYGFAINMLKANMFLTYIQERSPEHKEWR